MRYDIIADPIRGRWYLDACWAADKVMLPTPDEIKASGARLLGVDLNADHLAAAVLDAHGNPLGEPMTVPVDLTGPADTRDGRLRAAISNLITLAHEYGCAAIVVENLSLPTPATPDGRPWGEASAANTSTEP
ncbi:hypothetical protein [Streptomyces dysideae]|uniref:Uncharacterized protein n=1 Tax=Streptomyces dysideae TaxID=909626 RepID=A0A101UZK1_9ACTN|nr:hypothetical protein [Streptomyces dysideae]KUO19780.1 hypothetical protein AQJ91_18425 [Streptomyces dysideae]